MFEDIIKKPEPENDFADCYTCSNFIQGVQLSEGIRTSDICLKSAEGRPGIENCEWKSKCLKT